MNEVLGKKNSNNRALLAWVDEMTKLCQPEKVFWCDGSDKENDGLCGAMVSSGMFTKLNENTRPGSYLARSHPSDVARVATDEPAGAPIQKEVFDPVDSRH